MDKESVIPVQVERTKILPGQSRNRKLSNNQLNGPNVLSKDCASTRSSDVRIGSTLPPSESPVQRLGEWSMGSARQRHGRGAADVKPPVPSQVSRARRPSSPVWPPAPERSSWPRQAVLANRHASSSTSNTPNNLPSAGDRDAVPVGGVLRPSLGFMPMLSHARSALSKTTYPLNALCVRIARLTMCV